MLVMKTVIYKRNSLVLLNSQALYLIFIFQAISLWTIFSATLYFKSDILQNIWRMINKKDTQLPFAKRGRVSFLYDICL